MKPNQSYLILCLFYFCIFQATDSTFVEKLNKHFSKNSYYGKSQQTKTNKFTINHYAGKVSKLFINRCFWLFSSSVIFISKKICCTHEYSSHIWFVLVEFLRTVVICTYITFCWTRKLFFHYFDTLLSPRQRSCEGI